jgi:hypothetical protein
MLVLRQRPGGVVVDGFGVEGGLLQGGWDTWNMTL